MAGVHEEKGGRVSPTDAGPRERGAKPKERVDVRALVGQTLIDAMEKGETPWQRDWGAASMAPRNGLTNREYRGVNRLILSLAGGGQKDARWLTYSQAAAEGWQVKAGERGTMIVKVVDLQEKRGAGGPEEGAKQAESAVRADGEPPAKRATALMRYYVFNAAQIDGMPEPDVAPARGFDPIERAEAVLSALQEKTGLVIVHGAAQPCYVPSTDQMLLPSKTSFLNAYAYYSCALHEAGHSTLSDKRMARREALGKRWGDEAYALEELRAELCALWVGCETGIAAGLGEADRQRHLDNHKAYLSSWIRAIKRDPFEIFSAARDAEKMADFLLGLARQRSALDSHKEWIEEYERAV